jgi:methylenetetrahydrofolate dehydrogenase (NADP+)/methenyltetrahydrofolate cyclohydrolase
MAASILDGKAIAQRLRAQFRDRVAALAARGQRPGLAVVLVGENPASQVYVRNKVAACMEAGMFSENIVLPASTDAQQVIERIEALNRDPRIHGILVQLPLPPHLDEAAILAAVSAQKDVDGFHTENVGALALGNPRFIPCTPKGVMVLLETAGIDPRGCEAVIVGVERDAKEGRARNAGDAGIAVGQIDPIDDDDADDFAEGQGDDGEVVAAQPQHRKAEQDAPERRQNAGERQ